MGSVPRVELLERQSATASLHDALAAANRGAGRMVFVASDAGTGKTSLARAFVADLPRGTRVLSGACDDLLTPGPLGPVRDVARRTCGPLAAAPAGSGEAHRSLLQMTRGDWAGVQRIPRGPMPATRENPAGLTERQHDVRTLLAEGLSNPETAERLVLSMRTVDQHVSAILSTLGVGSRREAARHAP
jgi:ATP/maltotriose-dependent transcriptional regulator MalT